MDSPQSPQDKDRDALISMSSRLSLSASAASRTLSESAGVDTAGNVASVYSPASKDASDCGIHSPDGKDLGNVYHRAGLDSVKISFGLYSPEGKDTPKSRDTVYSAEDREAFLRLKEAREQSVQVRHIYIYVYMYIYIYIHVV